MPKQVHKLKIWPEYFEAVQDGSKLFEIRLDDRGYRTGDVLILKEYDPKTNRFTGNQIMRTVTYIVRQKDHPECGLCSGYVCMSLKR